MVANDTSTELSVFDVNDTSVPLPVFNTSNASTGLSVSTASETPEDSSRTVLLTTNASEVNDAEKFEQRRANDDITEDEYRVKQAHEVATKVLSTKDDTELQAVTFRSLFLGVGFSAFGAVLAQIYYFKPQTLNLSTLLVLILSYWTGHAMHLAIPSKGILRWINPGPFNVKEHVAIVIMSSTASTSATAIQVIAVQNLYYNNNLNAGVAIFTLIASQLIGYGYAGLLKDALVKPTHCFWPSNIYIANLLQALHWDNQMTSKRVRFFWFVFMGIFCWEIFPEWIFPVLSGISIVCLVDGSHASIIRNIFGGASNNEGMSLLTLSLDWNQITSTPLWIPLQLQLNAYTGIILTYVLMSAVYYGNLWKAQVFPFMSQVLYNATGSEYNQTAVLTDGRFDPVKYEQLGPAYYSATFALSLITSNLSLAAMVTHVGIYHYNDLKPLLLSFNPWNPAQDTVQDPHWEKMKVYKQIPRWWYIAILLGAYGMAQATNYTGDSGLPWWLLTVLLIIGFFFCAFAGVLHATLGFPITPTGFFEMITAYMLPGNPVANMYGALYGVQPMTQGLAFLSDLKLGQYTKLAPRVTFCMQLSGTIIGALLNYTMMLSIINAQRPTLLSVAGSRLWSGGNVQAYNSNAISWGALGPHMYGPHSTYHMVPISLAIGLFLPLPFHLAYRIWPRAGFHYVNTAVVMGYADYLYSGINAGTNMFIAVGLFSQWWVRRHYPVAFAKYNFIIAAALDGGTQVLLFILNFAVFGAAGTAHPFPQWWGNDLSLSADRCALPSS